MIVPAVTRSPANLLMPSLFACESRPFFAAPPFLRPLSILRRLYLKSDLLRELPLEIAHATQQKIRYPPQPLVIGLFPVPQDHTQLSWMGC